MDMEVQYITEDHLWYKDSYINPSSEYTDYMIYNGPGNTNPESIIYGLTELLSYDGTVKKVMTLNLKIEIYKAFEWYRTVDGKGMAFEITASRRTAYRMTIC